MSSYCGYRRAVEVKIEIHQQCVDEVGTFKPLWKDRFIVHAEVLGPVQRAILESSVLDPRDVKKFLERVESFIRQHVDQKNPITHEDSV